MQAYQLDPTVTQLPHPGEESDTEGSLGPASNQLNVVMTLDCLEKAYGSYDSNRSKHCWVTPPKGDT